MAVVTWEGVLEGEELAYLTEIPGGEAHPVPLPDSTPKLEAALRARGVDRLFTHQAESLAAARRGEHVVVAIGTASGKTLAFNLPVLDARARRGAEAASALPLSDEGPRAGSGPLPRRARRRPGEASDLRRRHRARPPLANPEVGQRNPDQPGHASRGGAPAPRPLGGCPSNLRYVVVDEAHVYRGVFGSHVSNVLRRLRRAARIYGAEPQFLLASATIANPETSHARCSASTRP